jgi:hypothetical protein
LGRIRLRRGPQFPAAPAKNGADVLSGFSDKSSLSRQASMLARQSANIQN